MLGDGKPFLEVTNHTVWLIGISQPVMADMRSWTQLPTGTSGNPCIFKAEIIWIVMQKS